MQKRAFLVGVCAVIGLLSAVAEEKRDLTDPLKSIVVSPKAPIVLLKLKSNPTTGYSWFLKDYDRDLLKPVSWKYIPPTSQLVGASGYEIWKFEVKRSAFTVPQITHLTLQYARPWSASTGDKEQAFTVVAAPK